MKYNTETISEMALLLAEMMKAAITAQQGSEEKISEIAQIETALRDILRQVGNQALGKLLSSMEPTPNAEIACECGGDLHYQRVREAKVISVFGKTAYTRAYYAGCTCQKGKAPLDDEIGLKPGSVTAGLAMLLALAGIKNSYDESPKWLQSFFLFDVSENTVRSETERMGRLQAQQEKIWIEQSQKESYLQERQRQPGKIPMQLYGSIDAAKVRIEPRPKKGEEKEEHEDWRDMKVLCWFETETVPPAQQRKRHKAKMQREQPALRAKSKQYFCDIIEAEAFGKLVWATGCKANADLCPDLVFLGDGAHWIWNIVDQYYPSARQIVDWYHAEEHLEKVATSAFTNLSERANWLAASTQSLWDGQVEEVIAACRALSKSSVVAAQAVTYFANNSERIWTLPFLGFDGMA